MASIYTFSDGMVDFGKRLADVADAVQGRGNRQGGGGARWLILPAAGAGLYALAKNRTFARQARSVMNQAKERASDSAWRPRGPCATGNEGNGQPPYGKQQDWESASP